MSRVQRAGQPVAVQRLRSRGAFSVLWTTLASWRNWLGGLVVGSLIPYAASYVRDLLVDIGVDMGWTYIDGATKTGRAMTWMGEHPVLSAFVAVMTYAIAVLTLVARRPVIDVSPLPATSAPTTQPEENQLNAAIDNIRQEITSRNRIPQEAGLTDAQLADAIFGVQEDTAGLSIRHYFDPDNACCVVVENEGRTTVSNVRCELIAISPLPPKLYPRPPMPLLPLHSPLNDDVEVALAVDLSPGHSQHYVFMYCAAKSTLAELYSAMNGRRSFVPLGRYAVTILATGHDTQPGRLNLVIDAGTEDGLRVAVEA